MNNTNSIALLKSLVTYALIVPVGLLVGYLLANPMTYSTFGFIAILALILTFPLLLRWHYPLLLLSWSCSVTLFFIKGSPNLCLLMVVFSLGLSVIERILNPERHFIRVPQITLPLMALALVAVITAKMTGGFGLRSFGSDIYGGKKYIYLFIGIAGYFALTSREIPPARAKLYAALFFLGGVTNLIGDLYSITPSGLRFIFLIFPPSIYTTDVFQIGVTRLGGVGDCAEALYFLMLARYGLRGIFLSGKWWRPIALICLVGLIFLGGFRTAIFIAGLAFIFMFFAEGLHRTKLLGIFILIGAFGAAAMIPLADKLPFTFQRALSFVPGLHLNWQARASADASTDWRFQMWDALLPEIPHHLLLGKGFAISPKDYNTMMGANSAFKAINPSQQGLALANDYHNGMISVVLTFGIWGVIVVVWFIFAGLWVMYRNLRYGRPELYTINALLFILFFNEAASYLSCFGGLEIATDLLMFNGFLGLSIALNHGVCRKPQAAHAFDAAAPRKRLLPAQPTFQH